MPANDSNVFLNTLQIAQASSYIPLIIFGTIGNIYVIHILFQVLRKGLNQRPPIYQYILALSFVDLGFLLTSWFLIYLLYKKDWDLGIVPCKLLWIGEGLNKQYSVYLLVWLSFNRYKTVCRHEMTAQRSNVILRVVLPQGIMVAVFSLPIYILAKVHKMTETTSGCMPVFPMVPNGTLPDYLTQSTATYYYLLLCFVFFVVPATLISTFYCLLVRSIRVAGHRRGSASMVQQRRRKQNTATRSVALVVIFYFACWTPYWLYQTVQLCVVPYINMTRETQSVLIIVQVVIYGLPYINSGLNPILYGLLNNKLRQEFKEAVNRARNANRSSSLPGSDTREKLSKKYKRLAKKTQKALEEESMVVKNGWSRNRFNSQPETSTSEQTKATVLHTANASMAYKAEQLEDPTEQVLTEDFFEGEKESFL